MPRLAQVLHLTAMLLFAAPLCQAACLAEDMLKSPIRMP